MAEKVLKQSGLTPEAKDLISQTDNIESVLTRLKQIAGISAARGPSAPAEPPIENPSGQSLDYFGVETVSPSTDYLALILNTLPSPYGDSDIYQHFNHQSGFRPPKVKIVFSPESFEPSEYKGLDKVLIELCAPIQKADIISSFYDLLKHFPKPINGFILVDALLKAIAGSAAEHKPIGVRRLLRLLLLITKNQPHLLLPTIGSFESSNLDAEKTLSNIAVQLFAHHSRHPQNEADSLYNLIWRDFLKSLPDLPLHTYQLIKFAPENLYQETKPGFSENHAILLSMPKSRVPEHLEPLLRDLYNRLRQNGDGLSRECFNGVIHYGIQRKLTEDVAEFLGRVDANAISSVQIQSIITFFRGQSDSAVYFDKCEVFFRNACEVHPEFCDRILEMYIITGARENLLALLDGLESTAHSRTLQNTINYKTADGNDLKEEGLSFGKTLVLTDLDVDARVIAKAVPAEKLDIYNPNTLKSNDGATGNNLRVLDSGAFNDEQAYIRKLASQCEKISFELASKFTEAISDKKFKPVINQLFDAIYITIRTRLIGVCRRVETDRYWMKIGDTDYDTIVILASRLEFADNFRQILSSMDLLDQTRFCFLPVIRKQIAAYPSVFISKGVSLYNSGSPSISESHEDLSKSLSSYYEALPLEYNIHPADSVALFVVRLASKTVPGTIVPVIKETSQNQSSYIYEIRTSKDNDPGFVFSSGPSQGKYHETLPHLIAPNVRKKAHKLSLRYQDAVRNWYEQNIQFIRDLIAQHLEMEIVSAAEKNGLGFDMQAIGYLLMLHKNFSAILDSAANAQVVVCPGRSAEAYIAQSIASNRKQLSMDVMNAWMSDKSTYASPKGDVVTVIDQWSYELMRDHFHVQEKSILKMGTPRYDGIFSRSQLADISKIRKDFGLQAKGKVVCFATQPLNMDTNLEILDGIINAWSEKSQFQVVVKLHPREEASRLNRYLEHIESLPQKLKGQILIFQKENIIDTLLASDLVITAFSNVAVESALCQKRTILCKFEGMAVPIPLDEMHLGVPVHSKAELTDSVKAVLTDQREQKKYDDVRGTFLRHNLHLKDGVTSQRIYQAMGRVDLQGLGSERPLSPTFVETP